MFHLLPFRTTMALIACCALLTAVSPAGAREFVVGSIHIDHPWSRATPKGATIGAGYMTITNKGNAPDRLVGGSVSFAKALEIHTMSMDNNVMKMRELKDGIVIKPGETIELKPQSTHLMFVGLARPLEKGAALKGTLTFEKAGSVEIDFSVEAVGGTPAAVETSGGMSSGGMGGMAPHHGGMQH